MKKRSSQVERQRSPNYPALSLPQSVEMVEKLHKANRTSVISRLTAAQDMGYSGLTGRSLTVLASLAQYGLVEKVGKGDIKVTRRAVDILHGVEESDRAEAILEAAFAPALFQQLHERFPEGVPSQNALRSYLIQQEFADVAIGHAINSFLETNAFAENAKESGRTGEGGDALVESQHTIHPDNAMMQHTVTSPTYVGRTLPNEALAPVVVEAVGRTSTKRDLVPNEVYLDIRGSREVLVEGLLDYNGILDLEEKLKALKMILKQPASTLDKHVTVEDSLRGG